MHWWFPYEGIVLCSERHTRCAVDDEGRLHSPDSMACEYSDGWGVYSWHGIRIPAEYYTPDVPARKILEEPNAEVRRALMERYDELRGKGSFITDCGAKVVDSAVQPMRPGEKDCINELLVIDLPTDDPEGRIVAVKMIDPSTGRVYINRVHPQLRPLLGNDAEGRPQFGEPQAMTVQNALASTHGLRGEDYHLLQES